MVGESGFLTAAVSEKLAQNGTLDARDVDEIYGNHIASTAVPDKLDKVGAQVADEIEQVMAMIETAEGSASGYSANLAEVSRRLATAHDGPGNPRHDRRPGCGRPGTWNRPMPACMAS